MSEPRTEGGESGSWPTARAQDAEHAGATDFEMGRERGKDLLHVAAQRAVNWPTATATATNYGNNRGGGCGRVGPTRPSLEGAARLWPTATATDVKASGAAGYSTASGRHSGTTLTDAASGLWVTPTTRDWKGAGETQGTRGTPENPVGVNLPTQVHRVDGPPAPESPSESGKPRDWPSPNVQDMEQAGSEKHPMLTHAARQGARGSLNPAWVGNLMGFPDGWLDIELPD